MPDVVIVAVIVVAVVLVVGFVVGWLVIPTNVDEDIDDLFALAASLHTSTCLCWECHVRQVEAGRRRHEIDQLEAQLEQSET